MSLLSQFSIASTFVFIFLFSFFYILNVKTENILSTRQEYWKYSDNFNSTICNFSSLNYSIDMFLNGFWNDFLFFLFLVLFFYSCFCSFTLSLCAPEHKSEMKFSFLLSVTTRESPISQNVKYIRRKENLSVSIFHLISSIFFLFCNIPSNPFSILAFFSHSMKNMTLLWSQRSMNVKGQV